MSMHELITHLATNLATIGSLGAHQKLIVRTGLFGTDISVDTSLLQGISRRYNGDSRDVTIGAVKKIVKWSLELHSMYALICKKITGCASSFNKNFDTLEVALGRVNSGLMNLMITYASDQTIMGDLSGLVSDIESRMTI